MSEEEKLLIDKKIPIKEDISAYGKILRWYKNIKHKEKKTKSKGNMIIYHNVKVKISQFEKLCNDLQEELKQVLNDNKIFKDGLLRLSKNLIERIDEIKIKIADLIYHMGDEYCYYSLDVEYYRMFSKVLAEKKPCLIYSISYLKDYLDILNTTDFVILKVDDDLEITITLNTDKIKELYGALSLIKN